MPSHLGGQVNLKIIHVIEAILVSIHLIDKHVLSLVQNDWPPFIIFSQIVEYIHFVELFKILPFVFTDFLVPLEVVRDRLPDFIQFVLPCYHESADELLVLWAELLPQHVEHLQKLTGDLSEELVLITKGWVFRLPYFLFQLVLIVHQNSLQFFELQVSWCKLLESLFALRKAEVRLLLVHNRDSFQGDSGLHKCILFNKLNKRTIT